MFMAGYVSISLLFSDWRKMEHLLVCLNRWRIQDFVNGSANTRYWATNLLITKIVRKRTLRKEVMFSQELVLMNGDVHRAIRRCTPPHCRHLPEQTDTPTGQTPPGQTPRQTPPRRRLHFAAEDTHPTGMHSCW